MATSSKQYMGQHLWVITDIITHHYSNGNEDFDLIMVNRWWCASTKLKFHNWENRCLINPMPLNYICYGKFLLSPIISASPFYYKLGICTRDSFLHWLTYFKDFIMKINVKVLLPCQFSILGWQSGRIANSADQIGREYKENILDHSAGCFFVQ